MKLFVEDISINLGAKPSKRVLDKVSFSVEEGEFLSLLGASGAGKSTILKIIAGILLQDTGKILFGNVSIDGMVAHKRNIGYVFQDMRLFPNMNVEENVAFRCKMQGMGKKERLAHAQELLSRVQLGDFCKREVSSLSGGQQQRVALARALAGEPRILLLDEPFSGLDENLRDEMRSLVLKLHRDFNMTTIMVTHDAIEAIEMSDRVVYISNGKVIQEGSPEELYGNPASHEIAACFGDCSTILGQVEEETFIAGPLCVAAPGVVKGLAVAVIRQKGARVVQGLEGIFPVRCCVYQGGDYLLRLDVEGQTLALPVSQSLENGQLVNIEIDDGCAFVYSGGLLNG